MRKRYREDTAKNAERKIRENRKEPTCEGGMSIEDIADCTGLSVSEVEALSNLAFA